MNTLANIKACVFALSAVGAVAACHHNSQPEPAAPQPQSAPPLPAQDPSNNPNGQFPATSAPGNPTPSTHDMTNGPSSTSPDRMPSDSPNPTPGNPMPSTNPTTPTTPVPPSSTP